MEEVAGMVDVAAGVKDIVMAAEIVDVSKAALAAGASDITHGIDKMGVADRAAGSSRGVSAATVYGDARCCGNAITCRYQHNQSQWMDMASLTPRLKLIRTEKIRPA